MYIYMYVCMYGTVCILYVYIGMLAFPPKCFESRVLMCRNDIIYLMLHDDFLEIVFTESLCTTPVRKCVFASLIICVQKLCTRNDMTAQLIKMVNKKYKSIEHDYITILHNGTFSQSCYVYTAS